MSKILSPQIFTYLFPIFLNCLQFVSILVCGLILASLVKKLLLRFGERLKPEQKTVLNLAANSLRLLILIVAIITALGSVGFDVRALLTGLGLTGFAVGFALKDFLANLLAGVLIIFYQPFRLNQYIKVSKLTGKVVNVDLRYTTLQHPDNSSLILVPNTTIFTQEIIVSDTIFSE